jgi:hypothetical protein
MADEEKVVMAEASPAIPAVVRDMKDRRSSIMEDDEGSSSPMDFVYSIEECEEALRIPAEMAGLPWNASVGIARSASANIESRSIVVVFIVV